jgi:hypothetical protein
MNTPLKIQCALTLALALTVDLKSQVPGPINYVSITPIDIQANTSLDTLTVGNVTVTSNAKCGGAVWSMQYHGVEYINRHDYGRLMQSALFAYNGPGHIGPIYNPTEGGANYVPGVSPITEMGSPCGGLYHTGNLQVSSSTAHEFAPQDFGGNANGTSVDYYGFLLGKNLTIGVGGQGNIIQYRALITNADGSYPRGQQAWATVPSIFYNANYSNIYEWSPTYGAVATTYPATNGGSYGYPVNLQHPTTTGGMIAEDPTTHYAMGVYMPLIPAGGTLLNFSWWNLNDGSGTGPLANACYAIFPTYAWTFASGGSQYYTYIVLGASVSEVASGMAFLQANNYR